jgi:hypothetical protein
LWLAFPEEVRIKDAPPEAGWARRIQALSSAASEALTRDGEDRTHAQRRHRDQESAPSHQSSVCSPLTFAFYDAPAGPSPDLVGGKASAGQVALTHGPGKGPSRRVFFVQNLYRGQMNFELSTEQRELKDRAAEFADREVAPNAADLDREDRVPFETLEKMADAGFMGLCVPEEYGGAGMDFLSYCLLIEELSRADAGVGVTLAVHTSAGTLPLVMFGTEEQKSRWVPPLARGEGIGCFALTEPETGSDASAIGTRAERVEGGYSVSGHKQWVTNGRIAGTMILFARAPEGVTAFVVDLGSEGISFGVHAEKMGVISATTDDVLFDDVFVPEESRLGEEGKGLRVALGTLDAGRIGVAAQAVGIAEAAFRHATQ